MQRPPTHKEIAEYCCQMYEMYLPMFETFTGQKFAEIIRKYMQEDDIQARIMLNSINLYVVSISHNYMSTNYKLRKL